MDEYIVSARKYRPKTFDDVVGQKALTTTLKNAVKSGKLAHAYLFCGPRGVGKTTCARIFARAINCMNPTAEGDACGECESCKSFDEQRSYNIFELDAASNNGVEQIKNLMEQTLVPPQVGKYKVFIIDEVHMLSSAAFNAFLKTLEEPPAHVIFILATTEKNKILPTIISRCQIYDFERMSVSDIINHLKHVADDEGVTYEEQALAVIAEKADGGMRDALSIFDQAASFSQGNITYKKVLEDLNVLDVDNYFNVIELAMQNKVSDIMLLLNSLIAKGFDAGNFVVGLLSHVRNVMMAKDAKTIALLETSNEMSQRYAEQAKQCPTNFLCQTLRILTKCDLEYKHSSNKRLLVELSLIEVAQITQEGSGDKDSTVAGHRPRRLKILFRNLVRKAQQKRSASQVADADSYVSDVAPSPTVAHTPKPVAVATANSNPHPVAPRPKFKLKARNTFASVLNGDASVLSQTGSAMGASYSTAANDSHKPFSEDSLQTEWLRMCHAMPQNLVGLSQRLMNIHPTVSEQTHIEVSVPNAVLLDQLEPIKLRIQNSLRKALSNIDIVVSFRLSEKDELVGTLSKNEILSKLTDDNPSFAKFRKEFKLELA